MSTVPEQLKDVETLLRIGVENGMTYAKESIEPSKLQFESLQVLKPGDSKFYLQFKNIGKILPGVDKSTANSIKAKARSVIWKKVLPAFKRLQDYLFGEYSENLRPTPGVYSIPNGQSYYQNCIEYFTSLKGVNASAIHQIGLQEVQKLRSQAEESALEIGLGNLTFQEIAFKVRTDDGNRFSNDSEALEYVKTLVSQISSKLDQLFSQEILQSYVYDMDVKIIPPLGSGLAYYKDGSKDGSRKGAFYFNPRLLLKTEVTDLVLHEAIPGHHLQVSNSLVNSIKNFSDTYLLTYV